MPRSPANRGPREIEFPEELPISTRREEIATALEEHPVVVVAGETGSGKTTQLPKICLDSGRGRGRKIIGHTQPRRIAARSVAERIAHELRSEIGEHVGYKMRFADTTSPSTVVKVMTDGILLNEIQHDRRLLRYDTLILDEAHERSLNVDFILGYLKRLLPRRPDLRLVITSATIDPESFSRHFDGAPIIEVSGRTHPVEIRYRAPAEVDGSADRLGPAIRGAVRELWNEAPGDVLVFLPGEREIRDAARALRTGLGPGTEVLPLYGRLPSAEQQKIFAEHTDPRVVLATNIAETSLTVPGIRYVVDTGLARLSRYSPRTKVQRLPIEPISQASAEQRAGRCGRLGPGVCIRLYPEEDFDGRDEFTPPEIKRTNLASVVLQMKMMRLEAVARFPFLDPPDTRAVTDGTALLEELGALDPRGEVTPTGRTLARFPVDPRIARMLCAAAGNDCLEQALVLAAGLSIQDPRERPVESRDAADEAHRRFEEPGSDFSGLLHLWNHFDEERRRRGSGELRRHLRELHLSVARMWEWRDVHRQLRELCREARFVLPEKRPGRVSLDRSVHRSLHEAVLTGFAGQVAQLDDGGPGYQGTSGRTVHIFPGSALFGKKPKWIVAANLVETTRLYARVCARVEPAWIERALDPLLDREYEDPGWDERQGRVTARERVRFRGLVIRADRRVPYDEIDPETSRGIFLAQALVPGRLKTGGRFLDANRALLESLKDLEEKTRRRDIVVGEGAIFDFYDELVPAGVASTKTFERWRRDAERRDRKILLTSRDDLLRRSVSDIDVGRYPDRWRQGGLDLEIRYRFEPGHDADGVSVQVPLALLPELRPEPFEWTVPGQLPAKVLAMLRLLPKRARRTLLPLQEASDAFLDHRHERAPSLVATLEGYVRLRTGVGIEESDWPLDRLAPEHRVNFQVRDPEGGLLHQGRDLGVLQSILGAQSRRRLEEAGTPAALDRRGITAWDFGELPPSSVTELDGVVVERYPALVDRGDSVDLTLESSERIASERSRRGVARLLLLALPQQAQLATRAVADALLRTRWAELPEPPWPRGAVVASIEDDVLLATAMASIPDKRLCRGDEFYELVGKVRGRFVSDGEEIAGRLRDLLETGSELLGRLGETSPPTAADIREQIRCLLYRGCLVETPTERLHHLQRYLLGVDVRLRKAAENREREAARLGVVSEPWQRFRDAAMQPEFWQEGGATAVELRFLLEELRISIFAQEIRTAVPASPKRIERLWNRLPEP